MQCTFVDTLAFPSNTTLPNLNKENVLVMMSLSTIRHAQNIQCMQPPRIFCGHHSWSINWLKRWIKEFMSAVWKIGLETNFEVKFFKHLTFWFSRGDHSKCYRRNFHPEYLRFQQQEHCLTTKILKIVCLGWPEILCILSMAWFL